MNKENITSLKQSFKCMFVNGSSDEDLDALCDFIGNNCHLIYDIAFGNGNLSGSTYHSLDEVCVHLQEYPDGCYCVIESPCLLPMFFHPEEFDEKYQKQEKE